MTQYAGEEIKVDVQVKDFDQTRILEADDVAGVTVTIFDADGGEVLGETPMAYDTETQRWFYLWDTTDVVGGTYRAKTIVTALDGKTNWEIQRTRLKTSPL